jgi:hypothetical protein
MLLPTTGLLRRIALGAGLAAASFACGPGTDVHGVVDVNGSSAVANEHVAADGCSQTGGGVQLTSGGRPIVVVAYDGASVDLLDSNGVVVDTVTQQDCSQLQADVHANGNGSSSCSGDCDEDDRRSQSHPVDGSVKATCTLPSGGNLEASVTFRNCE